MVMLPNHPKPPQFLYFALLFVFLQWVNRDFKFGRQVDHMDDKPSLKEVSSHHVTNFKFLVPLKYVQNS